MAAGELPETIRGLVFSALDVHHQCLPRSCFGSIADLGGGAGHVAAFLADAGAIIVSLSLLSGMVAQARRRYPHLSFRQ